MARLAAELSYSLDYVEQTTRDPGMARRKQPTVGGYREGIVVTHPDLL